MTREELDTILAAHREWVESKGEKGKRADLRCADLRCADLRRANLRSADLRYADLCYADLSYADLSGANLCDADLGDANLSDANLSSAILRDAILRDADLRRADLRDADLREADIDFTSWPLWCGSLNIKIDARIAAQLMYHAMRAIQSVKGDADVAAVLANPDCIRLANRFHRADECGRIGEPAANMEAQK